MTAEADRSWQEAEATRLRERLRRGLKASYIRLRRGVRWLWQRLPFRHGFSSLTRRIVILNLIGLAILVSGILYLNQFRAGLIDAKVQSLLTQGEIIAGALAASAGVDTDQVQLDPEKLLESEPGPASSGADDSLGFTIDPERAAPILRRLVKPTGSRARIYGRDGALILDSDTFYSRGEVLRYDLPPPDAEKPDALTAFWQAVKTRMRQYDLPLYNEIGGDNGKAYPEVASALTGTSVPIVRVNDKGELVVSVAVPVQRLRAVLGVLLLSTRGGDIDNIVAAERWGIVRVSLFAAAVTVVLSMILANTIAGPVQRLASAAERVRHSVKARAEIPDFTDRTDEIGHLVRRAPRHDPGALQADRCHRELRRRRGARAQEPAHLIAQRHRDLAARQDSRLQGAADGDHPARREAARPADQRHFRCFQARCRACPRGR